MKKSAIAILLGISGMIVTAFSNCTAFQADRSYDQPSTSTLLSLGNVSLLREQDAQVYIPPDLSYGPEFKASVFTTCSDYGSSTLKGNVVRSSASIALIFSNNATGASCTYSDEQIREHLMGEHQLVIPNFKKICPNLGEGTYTLQLIGNGTTSNLLAGDPDTIRIRMGDAAPFQVTVTKDQYNSLVMSPAAAMNGIKPSILLGANQTGTDITSNPGNESSDENCDRRASPLLVQIHPGSSFINRIELTPQTAGIGFDILGSKDTPAHQKRMISWFTPETIEGNFFVVLPDASGAVNGIDQMFGDNTLGPDGAYAPNGYEALRKYDDNHDGKITSDDAVFAKLRLWQDKNLDGVAQPYELYPLSSFNVTEIDLGYDANFGETDQFGNQIKLKSVVHTADGLVHVMYDIWFKYY